MRALKFAKYLPENGWKPFVVTAVPDDCYYEDAWSRDSLLLEQLSDDATIISVSSPLERNAKAYFNKTKHSKSESKTTQPLIKGRLHNSISLLINIAKWLYVWQDQAILWFPYAYNAVSKIIKTDQPDAFLTTTPPHLLQLLGLTLKYRTKLPWIADFRDGWTNNFLFRGKSRLRQWVDNWVESKVVKHADAIIVVTKHMQTSLRQVYPNYASKIHLVYNGFDSEDFQALPGSQRVSTNTIRFDYVGNWGGFRDPSPLFNAFEELFDEGMLSPQDISLTFTGGYHGNKAAIPAWVNVRPPVPHKAALQIMTESDVLILLASMEEQAGAFTSKIFEYLASRCPVLALIPPSGELADLLHDYPGGLVASPINRQEIKQKIMESLNMAQHPHSAAQSDVSLFDRRYQTRELARIIELCL